MKRIILSIIIVFSIVLLTIGGVYAYYSVSGSNSVINGTAAEVDIDLTVTKILPNTSVADNMLVTKYSELPTALNNRCVGASSYYSCQLYQITIKNNTTNLGTNIRTSVAFENETIPNLSWIALESYSSSTSYTSSSFPSSFNTASSSYADIASNYLLSGGSSKTYYLLVWVNSTEEAQSDNGSYTGKVKVTDSNGGQLTSTF